MATYYTPGVYIEEISTFPPSVAQVSTAVPAFIGYTEKGAGQVERINTLLEYEAIFGRAKPSTFQVNTQTTGSGQSGFSIARSGTNPDFLMYYSLSHYFKNGGGSCYVISIGDYSNPLAQEDFSSGLDALAKEDEPTLILLPDATNLGEDYYSLCDEVLAQCNKLGDRFGIFDVIDTVEAFRNGIGTNYLKYGAAYFPRLFTTLTYQYDEAGVSVDSGGTLEDLRDTNTALYNQIKAELAKQRITLPASPAVAGVYAAVDRDRGVWKAPANVSLTSVIGPTVKITHEDQEKMNIDPTAGKSINAIRAFAGKGTLVWGSRTLAGNDNEWRYISVRRLFNTIEESTKKASAFAVFEPNNSTTWLKVKAMIEAYLYGLWEQGALMGSTPDTAYFVNVGLGKTMTPQDVLEGRMIVEIGIAAVRPAEFIILRFTHKLPEA